MVLQEELNRLDEHLRVGLFLCMKGECRLVLNDVGCTLRGGDAFVKSPLVQINLIEVSDDFEYVVMFEDDIEVLIPLAGSHFEFIQEILRLNRFWCSIGSDDQAFLLSLRERIVERKRALQHEPLEPTHCMIAMHHVAVLEQTMVLEFVNIYLAQHSVDVDRQDKEQSVIMRFLVLVFQHYKQHRQVQFYAEQLHFSSNHLGRIVKKASHRTPSEWIALVTVNQAKKLLRQGNVSVKEVAQELGFPEQFTFRKYFKLYTGVSPKDYMKQQSMGWG